MRARAAYISSFGTTGILVASALLMLAMVSALVTFHAWPGGVPGDNVSSVPLSQGPATTVALRSVRTARSPLTVARPAHRTAARHLSTRGLVKDPSHPAAAMTEVSKVGNMPSGPTMTPAAPGSPQAGVPGAPSGPVPPTDPPPLPSGGTGQVQQVVDQALGQLPSPPGSPNGASVTLPSLEQGQPASVGVAFGSTGVSVHLP